MAAGELDQLEVAPRLLASQQSHVVDLIISQPVHTKKARIEADQAIKDIRAGMSDGELMQKYNISARGLQSLFRKLLAASLISRRELTARRNSPRQAEIAFAKDSARASEDAVPLGGTRHTGRHPSSLGSSGSTVCLRLLFWELARVCFFLLSCCFLWRGLTDRFGIGVIPEKQRFRRQMRPCSLRLRRWLPCWRQ